jgi:hypothetical protein
MIRLVVISVITLLTNGVILPAYAADAHKWVDAKGITHYADRAPGSSPTQVIALELRSNSPASLNSTSQYYSIRNQWTRSRKAYIDAKKMARDKAELKAAQQPVIPQIIYFNEPNKKRYALPFYRKHYHRHQQSRHHRKSKHFYRSFRKTSLREARYGNRYRDSRKFRRSSAISGTQYLYSRNSRKRY